VTEQDVALGDPVYVRHTSDGGSNTQPGTFRKDADSGNAVQVKGARWVKAGTAGLGAALFFDATVQDGVGEACVFVWDNASTSADSTKKIFKTPSDRYFVIDGAQYINPTGLAADATNYFILKVLNGSGIAATWSTISSGEGALTADTFATLTNGTLALRTVPPSTVVSFFMDLNGTQTLPVGRLVVHGRYI
jgi:hypothetical protein